MPRGGRYIYIVREPGDVLVSFYYFLNGVLFEDGSIDMDTFALELFLADLPPDDMALSASARYWEHVRSWWQARTRSDVRFQFDDHPTNVAFCRMMGLPPAPTTKVRAGRVGARHEELSPRIAAMLAAEWQRVLAEPLGLRSHDHLRATLAHGSTT